MKKKGIGEKLHLKKNIGSRSGHGSTGFGQVVALADLLTNSDRSSHRIDPLGQSEFNNYDTQSMHFFLIKKNININILIFKI
jgi:hypothetical protein